MNASGVVLLARLSPRSGDGAGPRQRYRLENLFEDWNRELSAELQARFQLRRSGDAFGAVFRPDAAGAGDALLRVWKAAHPTRVEAALAAGGLTARGGGPAEPNAGLPGVHQFEGPALEAAEEELAELAATPFLVSARGGGRGAGRAEGEGRRAAAALRHFGTQLYLRLLDWTPRQMEVYETHRRRGTQGRAARELGISQPTVSETLGRIEAEATRAAEERFRGLVGASLGTASPEPVADL